MSSSRPVSSVSLDPSNTQPQAPPSPGENTEGVLASDTPAQDVVVPSEASPAGGGSPVPDTLDPGSKEPTIYEPAPEYTAQDTAAAELSPEAADAVIAAEVPPASDKPASASQDTPETIPLSVVEAQGTSSNLEASPPSDTSTPLAVDTHLPIAAAFLDPPRASFLTSDPPTPGDSDASPSVQNSTHLLTEKQASSDVEETSAQPEKRKPLFRRPMVLLAALLALIIVIVAVIVPLYFFVIKKHGSSGHSTSSGGSGGGSPTAAGSGAITGGDGSIITTETGDTFTYKNPFGGFCE